MCYRPIRTPCIITLPHWAECPCTRCSSGLCLLLRCCDAYSWIGFVAFPSLHFWVKLLISDKTYISLYGQNSVANRMKIARGYSLRLALNFPTVLWPGGCVPLMSLSSPNVEGFVSWFSSVFCWLHTSCPQRLLSDQLLTVPCRFPLFLCFGAASQPCSRAQICRGVSLAAIQSERDRTGKEVFLVISWFQS